MPAPCKAALDAFLASEASPGWRDLAPFKQSKVAAICAALDASIRQGMRIAPPPERIFAALSETRLGSVRVVILGQDPYPTRGDANGLAFSYGGTGRLPRSLANIFKEMADDLGTLPPTFGDLAYLARQGVLLLNTALTVAEGAGEAGAHLGLGWESVTDAIIAGAADANPHLVAMLWGAHAQKKRALIDETRHFVIASPHPSPLSARRGFFGSKPFSRANAFLESQGIAPILWGRETRT
jgi:uracil-DNA glycosylase